MPNIEIVLFEGRTMEQKRKLVKSVTDAVVSSIGGERDAVKIRLTEVSKANYASAGVLYSDKK